MLHEALTAAEALRGTTGLGLAVVAMPWLNRFDADWLARGRRRYEHVFVLEDHSPVGGLGGRAAAAQPRPRGHGASASRAGPPAGRRRRRFVTTGSTARSLADRMAARLGARAGR